VVPWYKSGYALRGLTQPAMNLQPRYNIAPTATIDLLNAFCSMPMCSLMQGLV